MNKLKVIIALFSFWIAFHAKAIKKEECESKFLEFHAPAMSIALFDMWHASSTAQNIIKECAILHKDESTAFAYLMQSIVDFYGQDIPSFYENIKKSAEMGYSPAQYYLAFFYSVYAGDTHQHLYWIEQAKNDEKFPMHLLEYADLKEDKNAIDKAIKLLIEKARKKQWMDISNLVNAYDIYKDNFENIALEEVIQLNKEAQDKLSDYNVELQGENISIKKSLPFIIYDGKAHMEIVDKDRAEIKIKTKLTMNIFTFVAMGLVLAFGVSTGMAWSPLIFVGFMILFQYIAQNQFDNELLTLFDKL